MRHPLGQAAERPASAESVPRARDQPLRQRVSASSRPSRSNTMRSQRSASSMTWLETSSVTPASASDRNSAHTSRRSTGSRATVGLVEQQQLRIAEQRGREPDTRDPPGPPTGFRRGGRPAVPGRPARPRGRRARRVPRARRRSSAGSVGHPVPSRINAGRWSRSRPGGAARRHAARPRRRALSNSPVTCCCTPTMARISVDSRNRTARPPSRAATRSRLRTISAYRRRRSTTARLSSIRSACPAIGRR